MLTIYTKNNCKYCTKVKELFSTIFIEDKDKEEEDKLVTYINCEDDESRSLVEWADELEQKSNSRKFPQVFLDGKYLGGCDDIENKISFNYDTFRDELLNAGYKTDDLVTCCF